MLENSNKNTSYFFALEKQNSKNNNISTLNINNNISTNPKEIAEYVGSFCEELYKSKFEPERCKEFLNNVKEYIPTISKQFKDNREKPLLNNEFVEAVKYMNTGKSPGFIYFLSALLECY